MSLRKHLAPVLLLPLLPAFASAKAPAAPRGDAPAHAFPAVIASGGMKTIPLGEIQLSGLLGTHVESTPKRLLNGQSTAYVEVFAKPDEKLGWRAEHIGKWLESACNFWEYSKDPALRREMDAAAKKLISFQKPDGWLGSYAEPLRFHKMDWETETKKTYDPFWNGPFYDIWCHYLTIAGLLRYHEATGDAAALEASKKIADLAIEAFGPGKQDSMLVNHDHGFGSSSGLYPISKLYEITQEPRYREFCEHLIRQFGRTGKVPILMVDTVKNAYPFPSWAHIKHCEFELTLLGMCQLYETTDKRELLTTSKNLYENHFAPLNALSPVRGWRVPLEGCQVPDTHYGFQETCDVVPLLRWLVKMAELTGDARYLDDLEWQTYNSLLSRDLPDLKVWPGIDAPTDRIFHCCYSMLSVGLSMLPQWAYFKTDSGVVVNWYETSRFTSTLAGQSVTLTQTTQYPLDGAISIAVETAQPARFDLVLRIPGWSPDATITVNGEKLPAPQKDRGGFYKITRKWKSGDVVALNLNMSGRVAPYRLADGTRQALIKRGPLLLAASKAHNGLVMLEHLKVTPDQPLQLTLLNMPDVRRTHNARFETKLIAEYPDASVQNGPVPVMLVPYVYSNVSSKPVPPAQKGVLSPYSEDGPSKDVRVEFGIAKAGGQ